MTLTNAEIAQILRQHADLMEIAGENPFRTRAFQRAADAVKRHERALGEEADLTVIEGVGAGIAAALNEILETGKFGDFEELQESLPGSLLTMLDIPGLGAKRIDRFYRELNITSIGELEEAAQSKRLRTLKGIGPKAEERIVEGIAFLRTRTNRFSIGLALPLAERLAELIGEITGNEIRIAGAVRRMCETVSGIDLLAIGDNAGSILNAIETLDEVAELVERNASSADFALHQGLTLRLTIAPPSRAGSAWIAATGSSEHLQALAELEDLPDADNEQACYGALGLDWIAPELRENRGEIAAAGEGRLPVLIELDDLRGDLHLHTTWSDGSGSIMDMAAEASKRDYQYLAICDHSGGLGIANGLNPARLAEQRAEIEDLLANAPVQLFAGSEVEVHRDGRLDFEDDILAGLDLVVASLHSGIRQDKATITERIIRTLNNPNVDIVAHPTGRLIDRRPGATYAWEQVFEAALKSNTALEINADPARLDMREEHARQAFEAGCLISIDSDAHHATSLASIRYGIGIARRAWVQPQQVINTWPLEDLTAWLQNRKMPARVEN